MDQPVAKTSIQDVPIGIETPAGTLRRGKDKDGKRWAVRMPSDYGFVIGVDGADGDSLDVFIGPARESKAAWIVHQRHPDGRYDEDKVMLGFDTIDDALLAYACSYDRADLFDSMTSTTIDALKQQWGIAIEPYAMSMRKARVSAVPSAWALAALLTDHPPRRRALYALLARSGDLAKAVAPGLEWNTSDRVCDLAGTALFGAGWPAVRHGWGLPGTLVERLFVTAADPVHAFERSRLAKSLAWAADHLPDPLERERAFDALQEAVR